MAAEGRCAQNMQVYKCVYMDPNAYDLLKKEKMPSYFRKKNFISIDKRKHLILGHP